MSFRLHERHLGLIQAVEHPDLEAAIAGYAAFLTEHVNVDDIRAASLGRAVTGTGTLPTPPAQRQRHRRQRVVWQCMRGPGIIER